MRQRPLRFRDREAVVCLLLLFVMLGLSLSLQGCRTRDGEERVREETGPSIEPLMPEQVRQVFIRSCESCHGPNGQGLVGVAPDLRRVAPRSVPEWDRYLRESKRVHPVNSAAPLWLTADEIRVMAVYLTTLPTGGSSN